MCFFKCLFNFYAISYYSHYFYKYHLWKILKSRRLTNLLSNTLNAELKHHVSNSMNVPKCFLVVVFNWITALIIYISAFYLYAIRA